MSASSLTLIGLRYTIRRLIRQHRNPDDRLSLNIWPPQIPLTTQDKRLLFLSVQKTDDAMESYDVILDFDTYDPDTGYHDDLFESAMKSLLRQCDAMFNNAASVSLGRLTGDLSVCSEPDRDATPAIYNKLMSALTSALCGCGREMITDGENVCYRCGLTLQAVDMSQTFCPICRDLKIEKIIRTSCCSQALHRSCLNKHKVHDIRCPLCRSNDCKAL